MRKAPLSTLFLYCMKLQSVFRNHVSYLSDHCRQALLSRCDKVSIRWRFSIEQKHMQLLWMLHSLLHEYLCLNQLGISSTIQYCHSFPCQTEYKLAQQIQASSTDPHHQAVWSGYTVCKRLCIGGYRWLGVYGIICTSSSLVHIAWL